MRSSTKGASSAAIGLAVRRPNVAVLAQAAAEVELEAHHLLAAALGQRALQADVGDLVLGAGVRAAVDVDADGGVEVAEVRLEVLDDAAATLLVSDTERRQNSMPVQEMTCRRNDVASTGTPASAISAAVSSRTASGHVQQDHVLAVGQADAAAAAPLGDVGQGAQVLAREAPAQGGAAEGVEARLATAGE